MIEFTAHTTRLELQMRRRNGYSLPFEVRLRARTSFSGTSIENRRTANVALTVTNAPLIEGLDTAYLLDYFGERDEVTYALAE